MLGCESLPIGGLAAIRDRLAGKAEVIDDDVSPVQRTTQKYRNPLAYVFKTKRSTDESEHLVLLVQYKTVASGDAKNTESTGMLPGEIVYSFGDLPEEVRLITLICSDVFDFQKPQIDAYYEGLLLLHIQLNNSPRHLLYKRYRQELFAPAGKTEVLCLNWASNIVSVDEAGNNESDWENVCGSAWYVQSPEMDVSDEGIGLNHKSGIYYTRHEPIRAHALQFDCEARAFLLRATKVFHHAIAKPRSTRSGPRALATFFWSKTSASWVESKKQGELPDDGFFHHLDSLASGATSLADVKALYQVSPIYVERMMAISAGQFGIRKDWHAPPLIDSMRLCEHEFVRRVTVIQDPAPEVSQFRSTRFASTRAIAELRGINYAWPSPVEMLRNGFQFIWSTKFPNRNVVATDGTLATVVHVGLIGDPQALELIDQQVRKTITGPPPEPQKMLSAEQEKVFTQQHFATRAERFCILFSTATGTQCFLSPRDTSFTRPIAQSVVDIGDPSANWRNGNSQGVQR